MTPPAAVAYLTTLYPAVSHSFIQREVLALRRRGVTVDTFAIRRCGPDHILTDADREAARSTVTALPISAPRLVLDHARALARHPRGYLRALRLALRLPTDGARGRLGQLLYFAEAVPLWRAMHGRGHRHVHAHFASPSADVALLIAKLGDRAGDWRFTFTGHGTDLDEAPLRLAEKVRRADTVVCVSDFGRAQLMRLVGEQHWDKLCVVRCGLDTSAWTSAGSRAAHPQLRILCVGRVTPEKGQWLLVDALADLRARGVGATVTFVGAGPGLEALRTHAATAGVADAVTFAGAVGQDRIRAHYERADVFCLPSLGEGVPVVLMEAMAMGLPVVASGIMGIPELAEHGVSGLLVPPGRADRLADALERLAGDAALRARLGAAGRARVLEEFDVEVTADRLASRLLGLTAGAQPAMAVA